MLAYSFAAIEGRKKDEMDEQKRSPVWLALDGLYDDRLRGVISKMKEEKVGAGKVNSALYTVRGPAVLGDIADTGAEAFADIKGNDIPATNEHSARLLADRGATVITISGTCGVEGIKAAIKGATNPETGQVRARIFVVGVLTSMKEEEVKRIYNGRTTMEQQRVFMEIAREAWAHGMICAPTDLALAKEVFGGYQIFLACPGVRSANVAKNDQVRVGTPAFTLESGASAIIMGRQLVGDKEPVDTPAEIRKVHTEIGYQP